jgi:hypothetical protein
MLLSGCRPTLFEVFAARYRSLSELSLNKYSICLSFGQTIDMDSNQNGYQTAC